MTIEIADRLIKLRKKNGYSQEELADKLGLSRQAVSKWERAEASPDTDNLICLAKLYGVSLDELLSTEDDVDTIVKEQVKSEPEEDKKGEDSITLEDDDGSKVIIKDKHIECFDKNGKQIQRKKKTRFLNVLDAIDGSLTGLAVITYIVLGATLGLWSSAWVFIFVPEILCSILRAFHKKNANNVNMAFIALFTYFFINLFYPGMSAHLWHPLWVIFLAIPAYHITVGSINKAIGKPEDDNSEVVEEPKVD